MSIALLPRNNIEQARNRRVCICPEQNLSRAFRPELAHNPANSHSHVTPTHITQLPDSTLSMSFSEVAAGTPKVLNSCLEILHRDSPIPERVAFSAPATPARFSSNSDVQFFRLVKTKYHYAYHKLKLASKPEPSTLSCALSINPYSRLLLLARLKTFNALNWHVPYTGADETLTELTCLMHGWECVSSGRNNNTKNQLRCTGCSGMVVLRFNALETQPAYAPFELDVADIVELNRNLKVSYMQQVKHLGHLPHCLWQKFHCPLVGVYYLTPHLGSTTEKLMLEYLATLRNLADNIAVLSSTAPSVTKLVPRIPPSILAEFSRVSNLWLAARFFKDNKENFFQDFQKSLPASVHLLAAMGWALHIQTFASQTILLFICSTCNQRVIIAEDHWKKAEVKLSTSKTLTPCQYPPFFLRKSNPHEFMGMENDEEEEEDEEHDPDYGHKPWCCHIHKMGGKLYLEYLVDLVVRLESSIGPDGEYNTESEMTVDTTVTRKRPGEFDLQAGLQNFAKLRKLYFAEE